MGDDMLANINPVHALHDRLSAAYEKKNPSGPAPADHPAPLHLIRDQHDLYEALVFGRQRLGWSQAEAEAQMGLASERHLSKIEPNRYRDADKRRHLRAPIKFEVNDIGWTILNSLDLCVVVMEHEVYDVIMENVARPRPAITTQQKRNLDFRADEAEREAALAVKRAQHMRRLANRAKRERAKIAAEQEQQKQLEAA